VSSGAVFAAALIAGLASSLGPCIAPRYVLLAAQIAGGATRLRLAAFISGCIGGSLAFAAAGLGAALLQLGSHVVYGLLAAALLGSGIATLLSTTGCARRQPKMPGGGSLGAAFLLGISCSLVPSPCCAPIAAALGLQAAQHDGAFAAATLLAFGAGHATPLAAMALAATSKGLPKAVFSSSVTATISGTLMTAVGALYAVLA
jgi:cytochrome c biogenesis protein CcdA